MKYCPNLECSYLEITGQIAEYQDKIDVCPDCNTALEEGEAPFVIPRSDTEVPQDAPLFPDDLTAVSTVDSYDDALWLKDEMGKAGIPAVIRVGGEGRQKEDDPALQDSADEPSEVEVEDSEDQTPPHQPDDNEATSPAFEIKVMGRNMLPAVNLIQSLLEEESESDEDWDEVDGNADENSDENSDELWPEDSAYSESAAPRLITNPLVVLFILFCALLAIAYLLIIGFPGSGPF